MPERGVQLQSADFLGSLLGKVSVMVLCPGQLLHVSLEVLVSDTRQSVGRVFPFYFLLSLEKVLFPLWEFILHTDCGIRTAAYSVIPN